MAVRFRKTKKSGPLRLTVGKKSLGSSLGGKVAGVSFNTKNGPRFRVTVPGTGVTFTHKIGGKKRKTAANTNTQHSRANDTPIYKSPMSRTWWFTALAALVIISGIISFLDNALLGSICIVIGILMFVVRAKTPIDELDACNQDDKETDSEEDL